MLHLKNNSRKGKINKFVVPIVAILMLVSGLYLLALVYSPAVIPYVAKPIDPKTLASPNLKDNLVIIPKIGVKIPYGEGEKSLNDGAWWRYPERGNPLKGGNFILAAHRFTMWGTINETVRKSPFYNVDKLKIGDQVIIDYQGKRYLYSIDKIFNVKPDQIEIEAPSSTAKLTLYTCNLGGSADGRVVLTAKPEGEVAPTN